MKATSSHSPATEYPVTVDRRTEHSCNCKWEIQNYQEAECISSPRFEVGGFAFRFLMYPKGDDHNSSGDHFTLYIYIDDPRGSKSDCFVSFKVTFVNQVQESMSSRGVFSSRFNREDGFLGLADYESYKTVLDPKSGFSSNGSLLLSVDICILDETTLLDDKEKEEATSSVLDGSFVSNGKFTWMIKNYSLFKEMIKAQKIISPAFHVGDSSVALGLKTSVVHGVECLALFLEIEDKRVDQSCWFMFKIAVLNKKQGHMHRDSCGRIGLDSTSGGDAKKELTYGWNDYMRMSDFIGPDEGFLVDDTVTLSVSFNAIQDSCSLMEIAPGWKSRGLMSRESDLVMKCDWENKYMGRFEWRIEKFKRLKDRLKRKKNKGLCVRSKRFQIGNQDFRLLVYPRGQAENPIYLSMFLEVSDAQNTSGDQNCFVNYRLSVVNQKNEDKSVTKESQDRCSKATKDWGWSEFMTLTSLFGQDTGYILEETAVFAAEVRILKETLVMRDITVSELRDKAIHMDNRKSIKWKMENFLAFKEIMATQKIFSKSFMVGECKLRIGVYVSVDIIYAYLEFDPSVAIDPDKEFWVSYRMAVANQKDPAKTLWKKSSLCTKTSINSDLQFMKLSDMLETNAGFVVREMVILDCEILDFRPSFEFSSEQEVLAEVSTDFHGLIDTVTGNKVDIFRKLLATTGCHLNDEDPHPLVTLKENFRMGVGTIAVFLVGFRLDHDDLVKVKHLLCQPGLSRSNGGKVNSRVDESSSNQANLMMKGFNFLQQKIDDLLLDIMVECCQRSSEYSYDASSEPSPDTIGPVCQSESPREFTPGDFIQSLICEGLDNGFVNSTGTCAAECSDKRRSDIPNKAIFGQSVFPPETSAGDHQDFKAIGTLKTKWPEPSVELLGLILDSLKALNGPISQGHPEAGRGTQSAEKISILLDKAPEQLLPDLVKLLPKLVNHSEHRFIACALLDQFRRPDAEPTLLPPKAVEEKNVLAEKLKSAEAERERFGKELKSAEVAAKEESLLDEIRQLKLEKEEEFARCQAYTEELEANLNAWKQHTQSLQVALNKEMSMHAPLYGVGLESLSPQELKTISDIHEAGLRGIHALLHRVSSPGGDPILSVNTHQNFDGMHPTALPMADRPPTSDKLIRDHRRYF